MRRKKLLRQVAAAAVALSMAVSLSAPAFAAVVTFDLANGGLVITAKDDGITVEQDNRASSTIGKDDEIVITGNYKPAGGAMTTAEENQQDENQPVTPAKAPAKEETQEAEDAPAAEEKQEQKDTEVPADPEQKTETENKDNNSDPDNEEKKEQNAPANGELNASAGEGQEPKAEDEGQPKLKTEAKASAEATASASDDASNGPRKASAYEDRMGEDSHDYGYNSGLGAGIVQIINNTAKKIKVSLSNAHIDLPTAADTSARGQAAIDVQGTGNVELKFSGSNTLTGSGQSAGIQKNDKEQNGKENTGTLTITADSQSDTLDVKVDKNALGQDYQGAAIGGHGKKISGGYAGYGTKNIVIEGNGTVNTNAQIGSGYRGGAATGIVIQGNAVVNVENYGIGGYGLPSWATEKPGGETDVTITGNANVTVKNGTIGSGVRRGDVCGNAKIEISENAVVNVEGGDNAAAIGSGAGGDANVTITGNAKVTAVQKSDWYGGGAGIGGGANGKGHVTIGGQAQVKATGSAEKHDGSGAYGAGAAIGDGGTTGKKGTDTVQNGKNQFSTDKGIQDGAKVEMTNIGHNGPNTVTQTRQNGQWVTDGKTEQPTEKCDHSNPSKGKYEAEKVWPNCTHTGSQTYRCSSCGEVVDTVELPVNPNYHNYVWVKFPATCTKDGYSVYTCSRCGKPQTGNHAYIVKAPGHKPVEITVAPTCTESGYTVQKCSVCGEETGERTNLVAPLGHEYKNGVCTRCGAPEPQENGSAAPNYTVTGAETYETSVVDGRYIIAVPSEDAALNAVLGDLRAIKAQGADVVVFRTRSRESSLVIDEMLAMGTDVTPFVLTHNGSEAQLTINGAAHNELIH
jgi:outer membrane biosynthesis protein TonB